jgi:superfamily II DNA/RNA helicase
VLAPTRELASQIQNELAFLAGNDKRVVAIYGGTSYGPARSALSKGVDIVVACPGRLEDLCEQRAIDLSCVETVVVDEADRMVDMGFLPAVRRILDLTPKGRQLLLFSATLGREVEAVSRDYQSSPSKYEAEEIDDAGEVQHLFVRTQREERVQLTAKLVDDHGRALVFCRTRHGADRLAKQLETAGVRSATIHGNRTQAQREKALAAFSRGSAKALVATDVAARGIHVDDLPCVVHFDLPPDPTDYVHRSGRTGRAGKTGTVVSFVPREQQKMARAIQKQLGLTDKLHGPEDLAVKGGGAPRQPRARIERQPRALTGTVTFFNEARGYGFVTRDAGDDLFVHYSNIGGGGPGRRVLSAGQKVSYEIGQGPRGDEARNINLA